MGPLTTQQTLGEIRVFSVIIDALQDLYTEAASAEGDTERQRELIDGLFRPMRELNEEHAGGPYFKLTIRQPEDNTGLLIFCSAIFIEDLQKWDAADLFNKFHNQAKDMLSAAEDDPGDE